MDPLRLTEMMRLPDRDERAKVEPKTLHYGLLNTAARTIHG